MNMIFGALSIETMASGHLCLNITENATWETFPVVADELLKRIGGEVVERNDAPDIRIWKTSIDECLLLIAFDDFPAAVSLESMDARGDSVIEGVYTQLSKQ